MNSFVITIVFLSAFMHAGWNLLAKRDKNKFIFFQRMLAIISIAGFFPAVISEVTAHSLTLKTWICVTGSGIFCGIYYYSLSKAYFSSDFSIVYPVARSLPVILIAFGDILRRRFIPLGGWAGILLVVSGCFLVTSKSLKEISIKRYFNKTGFWLLLTASGTVGYTILDKIASENVLKGPATAARYGYFFFLITFLVYSFILHLDKTQKMKKEIDGWKVALPGAIFDFGSYWLILWAYQLTKFASYVVSFRQSSILIGVIFAFSVYKEERSIIRFAGTILLTAGLLIIAFYK